MSLPFIITQHIEQTGWFIGRAAETMGNKNSPRLSGTALTAMPCGELGKLLTVISLSSPISPGRGWDIRSFGFELLLSDEVIPDLLVQIYLYNALNFVLSLSPTATL